MKKPKGIAVAATVTLAYVRCPKCRSSVACDRNADRARCNVCGETWPWTKDGMVKGTR